MTRVLLGAIVAAVAMFVIGGLLYASGIQKIATHELADPQAAAVQQALSANLGTETGTYAVPGTGTPQQTAMYGKGPIATIHYNFHGFSATDGGALVGGFILYLVTALIIGAALLGIAGQVGRAAAERLALLFAVAAAAYIQLKEPLFYHHDWGVFIYQFIADALTLGAGGFIIAHWFLPRGAAQATPSAAPPES